MSIARPAGWLPPSSSWSTRSDVTMKLCLAAIDSMTASSRVSIRPLRMSASCCAVSGPKSIRGWFTTLFGDEPGSALTMISVAR